jgi:hypothetical protein
MCKGCSGNQDKRLRFVNLKSFLQLHGEYSSTDENVWTVGEIALESLEEGWWGFECCGSIFSGGLVLIDSTCVRERADKLVPLDEIINSNCGTRHCGDLNMTVDFERKLRSRSTTDP